MKLRPTISNKLVFAAPLIVIKKAKIKHLLHRIVTENTLENPEHEGCYRDDMVYIINNQGETIYTPPPAGKILPAMEKFIEWMNLKKKRNLFIQLLKRQ